MKAAIGICLGDMGSERSSSKRSTPASIARIVRHGYSTTSHSEQYITRFGGIFTPREAAGELAAKTLERYRGMYATTSYRSSDAVALERLTVGHVRNALGAWRIGARRMARGTLPASPRLAR